MFWSVQPSPEQYFIYYFIQKIFLNEKENKVSNNDGRTD